MKKHLLIAVLAMVVAGSAVVAARSSEQSPLAPVAELICDYGMPFPTSDLFEMLELDIPFLMIANKDEMLAAPASQCESYKPIDAQSFVLVIGHRNHVGTATFYITSTRGKLITAARGITEKSGETKYLTITPTEKMKMEFEAAKDYWLSVSRATQPTDVRQSGLRTRKP